MVKAYFEYNDMPSHLFSPSYLDVTGDLMMDPLSGEWFQIGCVTLTDEVSRPGSPGTF